MKQRLGDEVVAYSPVKQRSRIKNDQETLL